MMPADFAADPLMPAPIPHLEAASAAAAQVTLGRDHLALDQLPDGEAIPLQLLLLTMTTAQLVERMDRLEAAQHERDRLDRRRGRSGRRA
ncbi:MAG TPA: hypothetical protein VGG68_14375 [Caulobacteraceae bacterium]|jgi:hypothetical protein